MIPAAVALWFLCLSGCDFQGCGPTYDDPSLERQELNTLQAALRKAPAAPSWYAEAISAQGTHSGFNSYRKYVIMRSLSYLRATAVHGRQAVLVDSETAGYYDYGQTDGVSSELSKLWNRIYRDNHPHGPASEVTTVLINDAQGKYRIELSVFQCMSL